MQEWKVLLIGGSSAVGKSQLARQLSDEFHIPLTEIDDIRISLQQLVDKNSHPDLYFFLKKPWVEILKDYSTEDLVTRLLKVGEEIWPAVDALIGKHIDCNEPVIFEGDGLIPSLLAKRDQKDFKAIFIWDSIDNLLARAESRSRSKGLADDLANKQAEFTAAFGDELKKQAFENNFEVINVPPLDTLLERVLEKVR